MLSTPPPPPLSTVGLRRWRCSSIAACDCDGEACRDWERLRRSGDAGIPPNPPPRLVLPAPPTTTPPPPGVEGFEPTPLTPEDDPAQDDATLTPAVLIVDFDETLLDDDGIAADAFAAAWCFGWSCLAI